MSPAGAANDTILSRRLVVLPAFALLILVALFGLTMARGPIFMVTWMVFTCGAIGGFVSIQQRMFKMKPAEIYALSRSWCRTLLVPTYGGIFALVLYLLFFSGMIRGHMFPDFYIPPAPEVPDVQYLREFFRNNLPKTGEDFAKVMFWSFAAGFCERLVPQVVHSLVEGAANAAVEPEK